MTVDIEWRDGAVQHYSLSSRTNTTVRVRSGASVAEHQIRAGQPLLVQGVSTR